MSKLHVTLRALLPLVTVACSANPGQQGWTGPAAGQGETGSSGSSQASNGGGDDGGTSSGAASSSGAGGNSGGAGGSGASSSGATGSSGGSGSSGASSSSGSSTAGSDGGATSADGGLPGEVVGTIQTVDIPLAAGAELVKCQNFQNPFGKDVAIVESDSEMVASHHMFVFHDTSFNMDTNSVADCSGIEFHDLLHMAQTPSQTFPYPAGVGHSLGGTEGLRVLVHLLNPTSQALTARVTVNFHAVAPNQVQYVAVGLFLNIATLIVPTGMSTQSRTFSVPSDIEVLQAVSHMHSRATAFSATTSTGATVYKGTSWNEPTPVTFNPPMAISAGTVITWACTYNNTTGTTLTFGESANTNEMCILAGMAYPKTAGVALGTSLESAVN